MSGADMVLLDLMICLLGSVAGITLACWVEYKCKKRYAKCKECTKKCLRAGGRTLSDAEWLSLVKGYLKRLNHSNTDECDIYK